MNQEEFERLINKKKYQVFLFSSPIPIPLSFAVHTWFVINLKGKIHRWEFSRFRITPFSDKIGVFKNFIGPTEGMNIYLLKLKPQFNSKLISHIEGGDKSIAKKMATFIETNSNKYPLKNKYKLLGPNSNSFTNWILEKFPESGFKLPSNAIGRRHRMK